MKTFREFFEEESKRGVRGMWARMGEIRGVAIDGRSTLVNTLGNVYDTANEDDYNLLLSDISKATQLRSDKVEIELLKLYGLKD